MMFGSVSVLHAFFHCKYFQLMMSLPGCNPTVSWRASVLRNAELLLLLEGPLLGNRYCDIGGGGVCEKVNVIVVMGRNVNL